MNDYDYSNNYYTFGLRTIGYKQRIEFIEYCLEHKVKNTGLLIKGKVYTTKTEANYDGNKTVLADVLQNGEVTPEFFIDDKDKDKWEYLKGAKTIERKSPDGFVYKY